MIQDTYVKPANGWTCFHCGETFMTEGSARDHFGPHQYSEPGCVIKVSLGAERGLLMALRKAEVLLAEYMYEDTGLHRAMYAMQHRHSEQLRIAEEAGYERGLKDAKEELNGDANLVAAAPDLLAIADEILNGKMLDQFNHDDDGLVDHVPTLETIQRWSRKLRAVIAKAKGVA